jgi:microcystin-dependent protein
MSTCTNCYNGCTEIVSDKCVKYTGVDIPALGITNGDTLATVEQAIVDFLVPTLDGTGIKPIIAPSVLCDLVKSFLPTCTTCTGFTLNQILTAIIQSACSLQTQVNTINSTLATLNADYTIGCLTGVTASSDTHAIVQAVITKLCQVEATLTALALNLSTNYSSNGAELDAYIANYLTVHSGSSNLISDRMVPYAVVPYFGDLGNFNSVGVGINNWVNIYLCNGQNGTPDLRGRTIVGVTATPGGLGYPAQTDPALGNPNYTLGVALGANDITLTVGQMPGHSHTNTASTGIVPATHTHTISPAGTVNINYDYVARPVGNTGFANVPVVGEDLLASNVTLTAVTNVTINSQGGNQSHLNYQPGMGCHFIQYRP